MKIKRFVARDMRAAFHMVREEQGPDAVILSSRRIGDQVEVVAALDYDEALVQQAMRKQDAPAAEADTPQQQPAQPAARPGGFAEHLSAASAPASAAAPSNSGGGHAAPGNPASTSRPASADGFANAVMHPSANTSRNASSNSSSHASASASSATDHDSRSGIVWAQDPHLQRVESELAAMRQLLSRELGNIAQGAWSYRNLEHAYVARQLEQMGLDTNIVRAAVRTLPEDAVRPSAMHAALRQVAAQLPASETDWLDAPGVIAVIGPTGVGKTTTVAKLAARYTLRFGNDALALVTTDDYRIGARDQLQTYGRLLGVPVVALGAQDRLEAVLDSLSDKRLVLIDTAGMSPADQRLASRLRQLREAGGDIRTLLALAATTQADDQIRAVHAFADAGASGCVITKLDESSRHGAALSAAIRARLPVVYIGTGQSVPEDLHREHPQRLVARALRAAEAAESLAPTPEQFRQEAANAAA